MRSYRPPSVTAPDLDTLRDWADGGTPDPRIQWRARLILALTEGLSMAEICESLDTNKPTINRWRKRFVMEGLSGLRKGKPRGRGGNGISEEQVERAIWLKANQPPPGNRMHWSVPELARQVGCSPSSLRQALAARGMHAPRGRAWTSVTAEAARYWWQTRGKW